MSGAGRTLDRPGPTNQWESEAQARAWRNGHKHLPAVARPPTWGLRTDWGVIMLGVLDFYIICGRAYVVSP
jgi:hypothetical protein